MHTIGAKLLPEQLGLGTHGGCEAAVHATRRFLANMPPDYLLVKLDFSNAFNNIHRDAMLPAAAEPRTKYIPVLPLIIRENHITEILQSHYPITGRLSAR